MVQKLVGSAPLDCRCTFTICWIAVSCAAPAEVVESGAELRVAQVSYSAAVIGVNVFAPVEVLMVTVPSFGADIQSGPALPELTCQFGWLKAFSASMRNWMRRLPSAPHLPGNGKFFCREASKYFCIGPRIDSTRAPFPSWPFTGRMNAAGLMNGSHVATAMQPRLR